MWMTPYIANRISQEATYILEKKMLGDVELNTMKTTRQSHPQYLDTSSLLENITASIKSRLSNLLSNETGEKNPEPYHNWIIEKLAIKS